MSAPLTDLPRATELDGTYPRPQLVRRNHADLTGTWRFAIGDDGASRLTGIRDFDRDIVVPYPPESPASGVHETGFLPVVWYGRTLTADDLTAAGFRGDGDRAILHFGAVDYIADVWLDGQHLGRHEGGQTPFSFEITHLVEGEGEHRLVVRAQDEPRDVTQPRGKQDWREQPSEIWYERTTGIWQPVWLEAVAPLHVRRLAWTPDVPGRAIDLLAEVDGWAPGDDAQLTVRLTLGAETLTVQTVQVLDTEVRLRLTLAVQENGQQHEKLLWSPEYPRLIDAELVLSDAEGRRDEIASYLGLRSVGIDHGRFLLNDRPFYVRSVLEQGYWPETHLAASAEMLKREVELIKESGFNSARIHQKAEDPRFLYWCDRLGLTIWGETANAYAFSPRAVQRLTAEWTELVRRDHSHPAIITWVPLNESWGVQHGPQSSAQQQYTRALAALTRTLDPSRPVVSNDGWEHTDSDLLTVHDYASTGDVLASRYDTRELFAGQLTDMGPAGRRLWLEGEPASDIPVMLTEFGGVKYTEGDDAGWGYSVATDAGDFERRLRDIMDAVKGSELLSGFCYTQFTDTRQEVNGVLREDRTPKLPFETLREIFGR